MFPFFDVLGRSISCYGLLMAVGILVAAAVSIRRLVRLGGCAEDVLIVGSCSIGFALVCGSVLYALVTYPLNQILAYIRSGNLSVFGGLVFYGGLMGGVLGAVIGFRLAGCAWEPLERAVVPTIPLGHAFGRVGCVMAGCCHGMPYSGPLALYYPASVLGLSPKQGYFPVQLLEALINLGLHFWLCRQSRHKKPAGCLLFRYLTAYAITRFGLEFLRGDPERGHFLLLSVSQWISIFILTVCCIWRSIAYFQAKFKAHPG